METTVLQPDWITLGAIVCAFIVNLVAVWRMSGSMNGRMQGMSGSMNGRMHDMNKSLCKRMDAMNTNLGARLGGIEQRLDRLETSLELLVKGLHIEVGGRGTAPPKTREAETV